jgi:hypothetical protein
MADAVGKRLELGYGFLEARGAFLDEAFEFSGVALDLTLSLSQSLFCTLTFGDVDGDSANKDRFAFQIEDWKLAYDR